MKKIFFPSLFLVVALVSCTEKIELELDTSAVRLVVEGNITDQQGPYQVRLATTAPYYDDGLLPFVTGAKVTVSWGDSVVVLTEQEQGDYYTPRHFIGIPGNTYTLTIDLSDEIAGTRQYTAVAPMPLKVLTDSCSVKYEPDWFKGGWQIRWYAQDPPSENAYLFRAYKNGLPVTDSISRWSAIDDQFFNGNYTMGIGVVFFFKQRNQVIDPGDSITLEVCSITNDYQWFVENLKKEILPSNPLFAPPPANVPGNISNGGLGYFAAYPLQMVSSIYQ